MVQGIGKAQTPKELCKEEYRKFLGLKDRLHETARQFLGDVQNRMPKREHDAERIVNLIIGDWRNVRPLVRAGKLGFDPFSPSAETFDSGDWSSVDASKLHSALVDCAAVYEMVDSLYKRAFA